MGRHKRKRPYGDQRRPCCADHLEEWDCGCSWGCDVCWGRWQCSKCHSIYGDGGRGNVRAHLERLGLLGAKLEVFKVQHSPGTTPDREQFLVYNKSHKVTYQAGGDTKKGQKLSILFGKNEFKVFVLGAWSAKLGQIVAYERSRNWSW